MSSRPLRMNAAASVIESSDGARSAGPAAGRGGGVPGWGVGHPDEVEQVGAFDLVELQGAGDGVEDVVGDAADVAAFELGVVLER